jgi:hypothetical protein
MVRRSQMSRLLLTTAGLAAGAGLATAAEPFVGRWAASADGCTGRGDTPATAVLAATDTTLSWFAGHCRIGKMYKVGTAAYLLVHCGGEGDVPVTLAPQGDRMKVAWNRARAVDLQRCR